MPLLDMEPVQDTRGTRAEFALHAKKNNAKSLEAGRPIYDDVPYIQVWIAGQKDVVHHPVNDQDKRNYPREWAAFIANQDQSTASGTPLGMLPGISKGLVEEAAYFKVRTIEDLANMPETNVSALGMGWPAVRQAARDYIEAAKGAAPIAAVRAENELLRNQLEALQRQVTELASARPVPIAIEEQHAAQAQSQKRR
jgi:hypothetical protein